MSTERHIIKSLVFQGQTTCHVAQRTRGEGKVHLVIQYFKQNRFWYDDIADSKCDQYMKVNETACVLYPHQFTSVSMSWILLKKMGVPQSEHPPILENLNQFAETVFVSNLPIFLFIIDTNVCSTGSVDYQAIVDYVKRCPFPVSENSFRPGAPINVVARESMVLVTREGVPSNRLPMVAVESRRVDNLTLNYRSSIWGLKEVRLDDLEDVIRENPSCSICLNNFAECFDSERITGLPCAHHYHVHCIVNWLEVNRTCPMCRRRYLIPMRTADMDVPTHP